MYPNDYLYSEDHEWVKVEGEVCILGITEYAQKELGDVVFVELPEEGQEFAAGDELGTIESVKAVAEFYTPVAGVVLEINEALEDEPEVINSDPHGDGWLLKLKVAAAPEGLLDASGYESFVAGD